MLGGLLSATWQKIGMALSHSVAEIKRITPIVDKDKKLNSSKKVAVQAASRWALKYPDDPNSVAKMHWLTYQAILGRDGGPFQSAGAGRPYYDFPLAL